MLGSWSMITILIAPLSSAVVLGLLIMSLVSGVLVVSSPRIYRATALNTQGSGTAMNWSAPPI